MQKLLKYTYLLDNSNIEAGLKRLWNRYQRILKKPDWKDLNEARAILYLTGHVYCEQIALEAISRRLHLLNPPLTPVGFFALIDSSLEKELKEYRQDPLFLDLEKFYLLIKKYKNKFVGGRHYLDEEKFIQLYNEYNPDSSKKIKEKGAFEFGITKEKKLTATNIKGSPASWGKETGKVRIILNPLEEGKYFKEGEILISTMTTPDFIRLMKKAKAVVTDQGGILCHAAIIAREFNIPCIVGTKNATKMLRDGDNVEVDAIKGIIKILK